jgi:hypothetical protein
MGCQSVLLNIAPDAERAHDVHALRRAQEGSGRGRQGRRVTCCVEAVFQIASINALTRGEVILVSPLGRETMVWICPSFLASFSLPFKFSRVKDKL